MPREPGETVYEFLGRREGELTNRAAALRGELADVENELAHVQSARRQIGNLPPLDKNRFNALKPEPSEELVSPFSLSPETTNALQKIRDQMAETGVKVSNALAKAVGQTGTTDATIKQLVMKAMASTKFMLGGATASEIRQFILDGYRRDISPQSLSPQLSRLKAEGSLMQEDDDRWRVTATGVLRYGTARNVLAEVAESFAILKFRVAKPFNSQNRRFGVGVNLEFKDLADLGAFKHSLHPLDFDHLIKDGFLEPRADDTG